MTEDKISWK